MATRPDIPSILEDARYYMQIGDFRRAVPAMSKIPACSKTSSKDLEHKIATAYCTMLIRMAEHTTAEIDASDARAKRPTMGHDHLCFAENLPMCCEYLPQDFSIYSSGVPFEPEDAPFEPSTAIKTNHDLVLSTMCTYWDARYQTLPGTIYEDYADSDPRKADYLQQKVRSDILALRIVGGGKEYVDEMFSDLLCEFEKRGYTMSPLAAKNPREDAILRLHYLCGLIVERATCVPNSVLCTEGSRGLLLDNLYCVLRFILEYSCTVLGVAFDQCTDPVALIKKLPSEKAIIDSKSLLCLVDGVKFIASLKGSYTLLDAESCELWNGETELTVEDLRPYRDLQEVVKAIDAQHPRVDKFQRFLQYPDDNSGLSKLDLS